MAIVDMNLVHIYRPPVNPPFRQKKQIHTDGHSIHAVTSLSQAALPRNKLDQMVDSSSQFKPEIVATLDKGNDIQSQVERSNDAIGVQGTVRESTTHVESC
jgi:hypothetical protein